MSKSNSNNVQFDLSLNGFKSLNGVFSKVANFVESIKKAEIEMDIQIHFKDDENEVYYWIDIFNYYIEVYKFDSDEITKNITFDYVDFDSFKRSFDLATDLVYNDFN